MNEWKRLVRLGTENSPDVDDINVVQNWLNDYGTNGISRHTHTHTISTHAKFNLSKVAIYTLTMNFSFTNLIPFSYAFFAFILDFF